MIRGKLAFTAEGVVLDAQTRALSAYNVYDILTPASYPFLLARVFFAFILERELSDPATLVCTLRGHMDSTEMFEQSMPISFEDKRLARASAQLQGLFVPQPCTMRFAAYEGKRLLIQYEMLAAPAVTPQLMLAGVTGPAGAFSGPTGPHDRLALPPPQQQRAKKKAKTRPSHR